MQIANRAVWLCALALAGCTSVDPRLSPEGALFTDRLTALTESYNQAHGTHYPVPKLSLDEMPAQPSIIGEAEFSTWTVHINRRWVQKDPCIVRDEALPHELAHLFIYYNKYGPPQIAYLDSPKGMQLVAMNGPGLQDYSTEHGGDWQAMARSLGANPCAEGYCQAAHIKRYPLTCPRPPQRAFALADAPKTAAKSR